MKNDSQSPNHDELKALLASSFHSEEAADVPPLPEDLKDRIRDQYGAVGTSEPVGHASSESFFSKLFNLFAQPAYSGAAAAILLLAVAGILMIPNQDGMRGDPTPAVVQPSITFLSYGFDNHDELGLDESWTVKKIDSLDASLSDGPTIIIDGVNKELKGYSGPDAEAITVPFPTPPGQLNTAIIGLMNQLKGE